MRRIFWVGLIICLASPVAAESDCEAAEALVSEDNFEAAIPAISLCLEPNVLTVVDTQWFLQARGYARIQLGDNAGALADLDSAVALGSPEAWLLITRSVVLGSFGRSQEAWDDLDRAAELYPRDPEVFRARGKRFIEEGRLGYAHVALDKSIRLGPRLAVAYLSRGQLYMEEQDFVHAIEDFDQALAINPEFAQAYLDRGASYYILRRYDEAVTDFNEALERGLDDRTIYRRRAIALFALGKSDAGLADLETLIARNQGDPREYAAIARILLNAGIETRRALSYSEMSVALAPDFWWAHWAHAAALEAMGMSQAAFEAYEAGLRMASPDALADLEWNLAARGYDLGEIDGVWTTASQSALEDCILRDGCALQVGGVAQ